MKSQTVEEFAADFRDLAAGFPGDLREALGECDAAILEGISENFDNAADASGEAWPARKDPVPQHPLLILEGDLRHYATGGGPEAEISEAELVRRLLPGQSGTSLAGIRRHEFGDSEILGRDGILARPYFGVSEATADRTAEIIGDVIMEALA